MALPATTRLTRNVPAGGTEDVRGIVVDDEVEGGASAKLATLVLFPGIVWKIGHQLAAANANAEYPDDGGGLVVSATSTTLKLSSTVLQTQQSSLDVLPLLVQMVSGAAAGQVRAITAWVSGTQTVTVNRAWGTTPSASDKYRLLVDCRYRSNIHLATEYSASGIQAQFRVILYDWGMDGSGALKKNRRVTDLARLSGNTGYTPSDAADLETSGQYPGEAISLSTKGFRGAKVRLAVGPASGTVDLFVATT